MIRITSKNGKKVKEFVKDHKDLMLATVLSGITTITLYKKMNCCKKKITTDTGVLADVFIDDEKLIEPVFALLDELDPKCLNHCKGKIK